jgi:hypothetical protein
MVTNMLMGFVLNGKMFAFSPYPCHEIVFCQAALNTGVTLIFHSNQCISWKMNCGLKRSTMNLPPQGRKTAKLISGCLTPSEHYHDFSLQL